jgi:pimeloyl-ACP methyl ester carboxylesterase
MQVMHRGNAGAGREITPHRLRVDRYRHRVDRHGKRVAQQAPCAPYDHADNHEAGQRVEPEPGTYGSSGEYAKRRTDREIDLVSATLDAIKTRHGYARLHLAGYSEGGHAAAALLARRTDVRCVVLASSLLSVGSLLAESGRDQDVTGNKHPIDPVALVHQVVKRPDVRIIVMTDPDDVVISARSQTAYVRRASAAGLPVQQIFAAASDVNAHNLLRAGLSAAADCARGVRENAIVAKYQNKVPEIPPDADDPPLNTPAVLSHGVVVSEPQLRIC